MAVVTISKAAELLGYRSRSSLSRLRKAGLLRDFDRGRDGLEMDGLAEHLQAVMRADARPVVAPPVPPPSHGTGGLPRLDSAQRQALNDAALRGRARLLAIKAEQARLALERERGQVVDAAELRVALAGLLGVVRSRLELLPAAVGPSWAGLDAASLQTKLAGAIAQALADLSGGIERLSPPGPRPEPPPDLKIGEGGENLAVPWPSPPPPTTLAATFQCFTWGPGQVGEWRANTPEERAAREAAWRGRHPVVNDSREDAAPG